MITLRSALVVSNVMGKFMDALFDADGAYMICIHISFRHRMERLHVVILSVEGISGELN